MGLIAMAATVKSLQKGFFLDTITIQATKARMDELVSVGLLDQEVA